MIWGWDRQCIVQCHANVVAGLTFHGFPTAPLIWLAALRDRNLVKPPIPELFLRRVSYLCGLGTFAHDPGDYHRFHGADATGSWRESVPWCSMHIIAFKSGTVEIHHDLCNPGGGLLPAIGHGIECAWPGPTNPWRVARGLRRRGIDVVLIPKGEA